MINKKEFRIGNLLNFEVNNEICEFEENINLQFHSPILVSLEMLKELGFKKRSDFSKSGNMQKSFVSESGTSIFKIRIVNSEIVSFCYNSDNEQKVNVKYIHRLQNLFFEITNAELELI